MTAPLSRGDLADLAESYALSLRAAGRRPATLTTYTSAIAMFLRWTTDNDLEPLERATLRAWSAQMLDAGAEPSTLQIRLGSMQRFAKWLVAEGELDADPFTGVERPRLDEKVVRALDAEEIRRMLDACKVSASMSDAEKFLCRRDEALARLLFETGLRIGEALALDLGDIDLRTGLVTVERSKTHRGRVVPIGAQTMSAFDRWRRIRRSAPQRDAEAAWLSRRGDRLQYQGARSALARRARMSGIEDWHVHKTRHTFATRWLDSGGTESSLRALGGWQSAAQVQGYSRSTAAARAADEARRLGLGEF